MTGTETKMSKSDSLEAEEEFRDEMGQREEERRTSERNEQQNLNQGMQTGTHSSPYPGIHWGPSDRMRSKIDQALPTVKQIEARAYELYLQRDRKDGQELEDWLIAETELQQDYTEAR